MSIEHSFIAYRNPLDGNIPETELKAKTSHQQKIAKVMRMRAHDGRW